MSHRQIAPRLLLPKSVAASQASVTFDGWAEDNREFVDASRPGRITGSMRMSRHLMRRCVDRVGRTVDRTNRQSLRKIFRLSANVAQVGRWPRKTSAAT